MEHKVIFLSFIFIVYSFVAWIFETSRASIKQKKFVNRGILNGPFVIVYGLAAVIISIAFFDTKNIPLIFIGSTIYSSFLELCAGKLLEVFNIGRWWDYSKKKFNLEGYICLQSSLCWGVLGSLVLLIFNPLLEKLFYLFNYEVIKIVIISVLILMVIDFIITYLSLTKDHTKKVVSSKQSEKLSAEVVNRVKEAYPNTKKGTFSEDAFNVYKFLIYLIVGGSIGCACEMVFCRFTMGQWMSRSSLIYGEISLVWGLALAFFTVLLHMYRKQSNLFVFIYGLIIGTFFEYICGSFCEFFYGYSFWDYKHLPLNINGRVQIVFALIWGFSALVYIKFIYKHVNKVVNKIPERIGKIVITVLSVLLIIDVAISVGAGMRFTERLNGLQPSNVFEEFCDKHYSDEFMTNRFKNLKIVR